MLQPKWPFSQWAVLKLITKIGNNYNNPKKENASQLRMYSIISGSI
jgi:hypothetical protein